MLIFLLSEFELSMKFCIDKVKPNLYFKKIFVSFD